MRERERKQWSAEREGRGVLVCLGVVVVGGFQSCTAKELSVRQPRGQGACVGEQVTVQS